MSLKVMNKSELRDLMLRDKSFLARLYTSDNPLFTRKQIINAESNQLQLLIQILHYFSNGSIPLRAKDYKSIIPISGAKLVNVPLTKVVLCLSHQDIVCTASLTSQILCLLITHVLTVFGFRISGEIVSIDAYFASTIAFEMAFLINTMVDPIICIIFSSPYRCAASEFLKGALNKKVTKRRRK